MQWAPAKPPGSTQPTPVSRCQTRAHREAKVRGGRLRWLWPGGGPGSSFAALDASGASNKDRHAEPSRPRHALIHGPLRSTLLPCCWAQQAASNRAREAGPPSAAPRTLGRRSGRMDGGATVTHQRPLPPPQRNPPGLDARSCSSLGSPKSILVQSHARRFDEA
jgi:hypothetical protein